MLCEVVLYIYKETTFEQFDIDCGSLKRCNIIINSNYFKAKDMNIQGQNV